MRVYSGILGQIGDIIAFTPTTRRIKALLPESVLTFAVGCKYQEAGGLIVGLPYIDNLFVTETYFERLHLELVPLWEGGWPVDLRGDDEIVEQRKHDIVFETRPRHSAPYWWQERHLTEELAFQIGAPIPTDLQTEICIPPGTYIPDEYKGKIVFHNDPAISPLKAWPSANATEFLRMLVPHSVVMLGNPGPEVRGVIDLRGRTTLAEAAAIIESCRCYVGIDSGLIWIAGSLKVPVVGLYGTEYCPRPLAFQPVNPNAHYLTADGPLGMIAARAVWEAVQT